MWCTWPKAAVGIDIIRNWGFEYVTGGAWDKQRWGTGYVWRSVCEPIFLAKCGEPRAHGPGIPNLFSEPRREHSRKPECAYSMAEKMMPLARRADGYSRKSRPGWEASGDEIGKFDGEGQ